MNVRSFVSGNRPAMVTLSNEVCLDGRKSADSIYDEQPRRKEGTKTRTKLGVKGEKNKQRKRKLKERKKKKRKIRTRLERRRGARRDIGAGDEEKEEERGGHVRPLGRHKQ